MFPTLGFNQQGPSLRVLDMPTLLSYSFYINVIHKYMVTFNTGRDIEEFKVTIGMKKNKLK